MSAPGRADVLCDLIDAVVYGDVFDCAVTLDEVWRYSLVPIGREELRLQLAEPPLCQVVTEHGGLYVLRGREALVARRIVRRERAEQLRRRARLEARVLQHFPFVRGLLLTGSVAADDAAEGADVDMLVIVQSQRLGLAFAVLAPLSRFVSRDVFCPNYYLSEAHLTMTRRDHYVARELMQAMPLAGSTHGIFAANSWVDGLLPNANPYQGRAAAPIPLGGLLQRLLELPFRGVVGDRLEQRARRLATRRLAVHHGGFGESPPEQVIRRFADGVELRFHGGGMIERATDRYDERRDEVRRQLDAALGAPAATLSPGAR